MTGCVCGYGRLQHRLAAWAAADPVPGDHRLGMPPATVSKGAKKTTTHSRREGETASYKDAGSLDVTSQRQLPSTVPLQTGTQPLVIEPMSTCFLDEGSKAAQTRMILKWTR